MMTFRQLNLPVAVTLLVLTFFVLSPSPAQAQSDRLIATIPFAFYAGDKLLPAADYELERMTSGVLRIYNRGKSDNAIFFTIPVSQSSERWTYARLVFNAYGDDLFLSEVWWSGQSQGRKALPSRVENELARNSNPARVSITLR